MLAVLVAGCEKAPLSIEEAVQISTEFEGQAFIPPPRTITDVLAVLDRNETTAEAQRREWMTIAESEPPRSAGPDEVARFYLRRAVARGILGQIEAQIADLKSAEELAKSSQPLLADIFQNLGMANVHAGNYRLGLEYRRRGLSFLDRGRQ